MMRDRARAHKRPGPLRARSGKRGEHHQRAVRRRLVWRCIALILLIAAALPIVWTV